MKLKSLLVLPVDTSAPPSLQKCSGSITLCYIIMGFQRVKDVTLVRHAYVLPDYQRKGIGTKLLKHVKQMTDTRHLLVGTWADAIWAVQFYQKHGFKLMPDKDELLRKYWDVPQRQIETSVVLGIET